jgi:hypothetical protein
MKLWHLLRSYSLGSLISLLILATASMAAAQGQMARMMDQGAHHMAMTAHAMPAPDTMSKGPAHAACQIICLGATLAAPHAMPLLPVRLIHLPLVPSPAAAIAGRSPDPMQRPPQPTPIA